MRWKDERRSDNVEDRRGMSPGGIAIGGGIGTLILVLIAAFLGADPRQVLNALQQNQQAAPNQAGTPVNADPAEERPQDFVRAILGNTEDIWTDLFQQMGKQYQDPHLVLFRNRAESACGLASASVGPFYCPEDQKVYIDLAFYKDLKDKFKAPGEFAEAYVVAHEIGHHVQNLLGISDKIHAAQQQSSNEEARELSVGSSSRPISWPASGPITRS